MLFLILQVIILCCWIVTATGCFVLGISFSPLLFSPEKRKDFFKLNDDRILTTVHRFLIVFLISVCFAGLEFSCKNAIYKFQNVEIYLKYGLVNW